MPLPQHVADRYEILGALGEGGMGIVYLARDSVVQREVALKTIRDVPSQTALDLFRKECSVLAAMSHPNIVEIFDVGEFEDEVGIRKPYFVMPLLRGDTLGELIRNASQRLTLEHSIEIILQTCRGLQAAHERGLVHRDLKPSNIFVLPDDSVKIIDFGVAHMADLAATMTVKAGTLLYMAPEQIEMKPASPSSDIFSLGVVAYEILTGRRPFAFPTEPEVIEAILHHTPPAASEMNPSIPVIYSRIIHKAMAKQPWRRFSSAREMAETLQKAQRNEPIEMFDAARLAPRLERAAKALDQGNLEFAGEIVSELESAGEVDATLSDLRQRLDTATRQKTLSRLLDSARTCMEAEEFLLARQKVEEVLRIDPGNPTAIGIRTAIETRQNEHTLEQQAIAAIAAKHTLAAAASAQTWVRAEVLPAPSGPEAPPPHSGMPTPKPAAPVAAQAISERKVQTPFSEASIGATLILGPDRMPESSRPDAPPARANAKSAEPGFERNRRVTKWPWKRAAAVGFVSAAVALLAAWPWSTSIDLRTKPPGATLRIDGVVRGQTNLRVKLRPGAHQIEVSKSGYLTATHGLQVLRWPGTLWSARQPSVEFALTPASPSLVIRGGVPGGEVRIDGRPAGRVGTDGSFSSDNVSPGPHEIQLSAAGYRSKRIQRSFKAGVPVMIAGADACLERSTGSVHLSVVPANAIVTYTRSGGKAQTASGSEIELEQGVYTITARAPGLGEQNQVIQVVAGQNQTISLRLRAQAAPVMTMDAWAREGWTREGVWYVHRGGEFVLLPAKPVTGILVFTALRRTGNNRIQWVVNYRDSRNYLLFAVDKKNFYRSEVANGRKREQPKIGLPVAPAGEQLQYTFRIEITGSSLAHFLQSGDRWVPLQSMNLPANSLAGGAFGFYLPGSDELLISGLAFTPKP